MAIIEPFKGLRYSPRQVPDPSRAIAPPYDVISPPDRDDYYRQDPHNIIRLILPKDPPHVAHGNCYDMAARYLETWLEEGVLVEDEQPAVYVTDTDFVHECRHHTRRSFIAAVRLEPLGAGTIFPHEETLPGPKADRLALLRATRTNLSPIFGLYPDDGTVFEILDDAPMSEPLCTVVDRADVQTTMRVITDETTINTLKARLASRPIFIADGHHRYETALKYRGPEPTGTPADYVMMACTSCLDPGLLILPTHRVVKADGVFDHDKFLKSAAKHFEIVRLREPDTHPADVLLNAIERVEHHAFGLYAAEGKMSVLRLLSDELAVQNPSPHSHDWKMLEVPVLHWLILHELLAIDSEAARDGERVYYTRDACEAVDLVEDGQYDLALLIKPTRVWQMKRVAELNERMPPKSTYFYPKLPSGLVLRKL